jgi:hypothetical protein
LTAAFRPHSQPHPDAIAKDSLIDEERVVLEWLNELVEKNSDPQRDTATQRFLQVSSVRESTSGRSASVDALSTVCQRLLHRLDRYRR